MERLRLGDDPWSETVRDRIRTSPHQATLTLWDAGKNVTDTDTPYFEYLTVRKGIAPEKAREMQRSFYELWRAAPDGWYEPAIVKQGRLYLGPITFRIQANGYIDCDDGMHRLNILHKLGLPLEGVLVKRHPEWESMRERLLARLKRKKALYHPIPHPDFADWPVHHTSPPPLVGRLRRVTSAVEFGTHYGYALYTHRAHLAVAVGVEADRLAAQVAKIVLERVGMKAVHGEAMRYLAARPPVDLVLALNMLHHVPNLDAVLRVIRAKARFVAVTLPNADSKYRATLPPEPYDYVRRKLNAVVEWEGEYASRRFQFLRVES